MIEKDTKSISSKTAQQLCKLLRMNLYKELKKEMETSSIRLMKTAFVLSNFTPLLTHMSDCIYIQGHSDRPHSLQFVFKRNNVTRTTNTFTIKKYVLYMKKAVMNYETLKLNRFQFLWKTSIRTDWMHSYWLFTTTVWHKKQINLRCINKLT